jgi:hypothetical protein
MKCASCGSDDQAEFPAEMSIHLRRSPRQPGTLVFQTVLICMDCGFSQFIVPDAELRELAHDKFIDHVRFQLSRAPIRA